VVHLEGGEKLETLVGKYLRKNNLTQRSLALKVGCTTATVNGLVNGKNTDIKISLLKKIHKATELPLDKLINSFLSCKRS
jgi:transcriptional regulator with XRE-family HTH domain